MPSLPSGINAASPLDASDNNRLLFTNDTDETLTRALDNMPANFESMDSGLQIHMEYRQQGRGDDTLILEVRIVNGGTILAAATSGGDFAVVDNNITETTDTTKNVNFTHVNQTADKATWDGATVELRQRINRSMGADGCHIEVDFVELLGSYTGSGLLKIQNEFLNLLESIPQAVAPGILYDTPCHAGPFAYSSNGNLYVALPDENQSNRLAIWRKADGDLFWWQIGIADTPLTPNSNPIQHIAGAIDGDTLHVGWRFTDDSAFPGDQQVAYVQVDLTTETLGDSELVFSGQNAVVRNTGGMAIGIRSDGTVLLFFSDYDGNALKVSRRTGVDTWAAAQTVEPDSPSSGLAGIMLGDDFHVFYSGFSNLSGAWHRVYRSDNTVSARDQINTTAATGNDLAGHAASGDGRLFYAQSIGSNDPADFHAYSSSGQADDETWSDDVLSSDVDKPSSGASVGVVAAGNRVFAMWVDSSEAQVHYAEWDQDTDQWGAAVDPGVDVTDESLINFEAWVDTSGNVHIGGLWGTSVSSPVNFFDIEVGSEIGIALVKVVSETINLQETDINDLTTITALLKQIDETSQLSEADISLVEEEGATPVFTGWGIPIGV